MTAYSAIHYHYHYYYASPAPMTPYSCESCCIHRPPHDQFPAPVSPTSVPAREHSSPNSTHGSKRSKLSYSPELPDSGFVDAEFDSFDAKAGSSDTLNEFEFNAGDIIATEINDESIDCSEPNLLSHDGADPVFENPNPQSETIVIDASETDRNSESTRSTSEYGKKDGVCEKTNLLDLSRKRKRSSDSDSTFQEISNQNDPPTYTDTTSNDSDSTRCLLNQSQLVQDPIDHPREPKTACYACDDTLIPYLLKQNECLIQENQELKAQLAFPDSLEDERLESKEHPMSFVKREAITLLSDLTDAATKIKNGLEAGAQKLMEGFAALGDLETKLVSLGKLVEIE